MKLTIPAPPAEAPRPPASERLPYQDGVIIGVAWAVIVGAVGGVAAVGLALLVQSLIVALVGLGLTGAGALVAGVVMGGRYTLRWTVDHVSLRLYPTPVNVVQEMAYEPPAVPARIDVTFRRPNDGGYQQIQYRHYPGDMAILARELLAGRPFTVRAFVGILSEDRLQELRQILLDDGLAEWRTGDNKRQGCELTQDGWLVMKELTGKDTGNESGI